MIWISPREVTLGGVTLAHVSAVSVSRVADKLVVEVGSAGRHVRFADVPEQRVVIEITRTIVDQQDNGVRPGDERALSFRTAPSGAGLPLRQVTATVVVTAVESKLSARGGAAQTISCVAVSPDGAADPVVESDAA